MRLRSFGFALLACCLLAAPSPAQGDGGRAACRRIVSLAPSVTELLFSLDCGARVVGRTTNSNMPAEALSLPDVGPYNRPSLEKIVSLRPDLCIALSDGTPESLLRQLRGIGIGVIELSISSPESLGDAILLLGRELGAGEKAALEAGKLRRRLEAAQARIPAAGKGVPVLFQLQDEPLIAAGPGSFAGQLIERAGGVNAVGKASSPYPVIGMEEVLLLAPQVIIIAGMGDAEADRRSALRWRRWGAVPAVRDGRVHVVDPDIFTRPSLRAVDALDELAAIITSNARPADGP